MENISNASQQCPQIRWLASASPMIYSPITAPSTSTAIKSPHSSSWLCFGTILQLVQMLRGCLVVSSKAAVRAGSGPGHTFLSTDYWQL